MQSKRFFAAAVAVALSIVSSVACAAAQRTFVSTSGADNAACSPVTPCRSFAAAITATDDGGEIIVLDSGGYGRVTITKSVAIIVPPGIYGGVSVFAGNDGINIDAPGATVVLRGLSINGRGGAHGVLVQHAARVRIENCVVSNMAAVGIYHLADNGETIVVDTIVRDNQDGLGLVAGNASILLDHVRSEHNQAAGFYIAPVSGAFNARATITNSIFANNGSHGLWVDSVASAVTRANIENTVVSKNGGDGVRATSAASGSYADVHLTRNTLDQNVGFEVYGLGIPNGVVYVYASNNSISSGYVRVDGSSSYAWVSRNSGDGGVSCANGAHINTYVNNELLQGMSPAGCVSSVPPQ